MMRNIRKCGRRGTGWVVGVALMAALLAACGQPKRVMSDSNIPSDFSVDVVVTPPTADGSPTVAQAEEPAMRGAHYAVLPDRRMQASVGPGADRKVLPHSRVELSHAQFQAIYELVRAGDMLNAESQAAGAGGASYDIEVFAMGHTHRFIADAQGNEAARKLVAYLAEVAGVR